MIFRIRLPRLENLFDTDDGDRSDVGRVNVGYPASAYGDGDYGYIYHSCTCVCNNDYFNLDSTFGGMFLDYSIL